MRFHSKLGAMAGAVALSVGGQAVAQDAVQWREKDGGNGHWYQGVIDDGCTWTGARATAIARGGDLVSLGDVDEADWVYAMIASSPDLWRNRVGPRIGLVQAPFATEPSDGWGWSDQTPLNLTRWNPSGFYGQENPVDFGPCTDSDFGGYYGWPSAPMDSWGSYQDGHNGGCHWEDFRSYIIEWSADCNGDGIVDYGQIRAGELPDANGNNIPDCCEQGVSCSPCAADIARDGVVNGIDLAAVLTNWSTAGGPLNADVNQDGIVDGSDLAIVLASWGPCP